MTQLLNHRYQVIRQLGSGGFGETFLAVDTQMPSQRRCVIKQLRPINDNPQVYHLVQARFQREAALLEKLGNINPQIPSLYAYFATDGKFYLVQEWIEGTTLAQLVEQQGKLPVSTVEQLLKNLLPVLAFLHHQGIVHRDIKPDNIILRSADNLPVLIDFGAVRETMGTVVQEQGKGTRSIIVGTPGFMPAEQAAGRPVFNSDLYSLGLTAVYLLTGKIPQDFPSDPHSGDLLWQAEVGQANPALIQVLTTAVLSHSQERFSTATAMLAALNQLDQVPQRVPSTVLPQQGIKSSQDSSPATGILTRSAVIGGIVGAAVLAGFWLTQSPPSEITAEVANPAESATPQGNETDEAFAPVSNSQLSSPVVTENQISPLPGVDTQYAWLSQRQVIPRDLAGKSAWELSIMRNSIYARKGRRFNTPELQSYFERQPWYNPRYTPDQFPSSFVSDLESRNASSILDYQNRNGLRAF